MANRIARRRPAPKPIAPSDGPSESESALEKTKEPVVLDPLGSRRPRLGPLSIWTTGVWERESMAMRFLETSLMQGIRRYVVADNGVEVRGGDVGRFLKSELVSEETVDKKRLSLLSRLWSRVRRT